MAADSPPVAIDLVRLMLAPFQPTPRGIDRVEIMYARHFAQNWPGDVFGVMWSPWGVRAAGRQRILTVVDAVERAWRERAEGRADGAYEAIVAAIAESQGASTATTRTRINRNRFPRRFASISREVGLFFHGRAAKVLPKDAVYLHVGHFALAMPFLTRWLDARPDIRPVFMLHDVIPLTHPEYVRPSNVSFHRQMVAMAARRAAGLILTTDVAAEAVRDAVAQRTSRTIPMLNVHLPVADTFLEPANPDDRLAGRPYFVVCGQIEARKNVTLLLNIWQRLVEERGAKAPVLLLVGARGAKHGPIVAQMSRTPGFKTCVFEVRGLSTPGLKTLIAGARALLMPSFVEGLGLPILEAMAQGTPVIASDIPAHREVARGFATLIDPIDGLRWQEAIMRYADCHPAERLHERPPAMIQREYFDAVERFTREISASAR